MKQEELETLLIYYLSKFSEKMNRIWTQNLEVGNTVSSLSLFSVVKTKEKSLQ